MPKARGKKRRNPSRGRANALASAREQARIIYLTLSNIDFLDMEDKLPNEILKEIEANLNQAKSLLEYSMVKRRAA